MRLLAPQSKQNQKMGAPTRNALYPKNIRTATAHVPSEAMIKTRTVFTNGRPLATHRNVQSVDEFSSRAIALLQLHRNIILPLPAATVIPVMPVVVHGSSFEMCTTLPGERV
jgi:hypothetical protein